VVVVLVVLVVAVILRRRLRNRGLPSLRIESVWVLILSASPQLSSEVLMLAVAVLA
jgi:hypothetical protein